MAKKKAVKQKQKETYFVINRYTDVVELETTNKGAITNYFNDKTVKVAIDEEEIHNDYKIVIGRHASFDIQVTTSVKISNLEIS